jgi:transcriptional regulator with XRE-family HTH domain
VTPTVVDDLAYIREFVGLAGAELADLFGASTEEVQKWFHGAEVPPDTARRIHAVADFIRHTPAEPTDLDASRRLREPRPELGGRSLLQAAADGDPPCAAAAD